jgi:hypothetical protein
VLVSDCPELVLVARDDLSKSQRETSVDSGGKKQKVVEKGLRDV